MFKQAIIGLAVAIVPSIASAAVTTSTLDLGASKDAMIFAASVGSGGADTGSASGAGPAMFAGADGSGSRKRSLIDFDVSSIPTGSTITGVTMTLSLAQVAGSGGGSGGGGNYPSRTFRLYDIQQDWTEGTSGPATYTGVGGTGQGYAKTNKDTTWTYASYRNDGTASTPWNVNGVATPGGNFSTSESAASTFTDFTTLNSSYQWSSAGLIADVQAWVDGTAANNGWLLKSDLENSPTSFLGFWTKEGAAANGNPTTAPKLTITYVPEPTSLSMMAIGGLLAMRRKRLAGVN